MLALMDSLNKNELLIMIERLQQFEAVYETLFSELGESEKNNDDIKVYLEQMLVARDQMREVLIRAQQLADSADSEPLKTN